jgi:hypothetical protein
VGWPTNLTTAIENAIAAIKAAARRQGRISHGLLSRGYERIGLDLAPADLPGMITVLADACAALEPGLADTAADVREVVNLFVQAELLPLKLSD